MTTKPTIADLFPDDKGMILVAEDAVDGSIRHISEVSNGAACGCICFGCRRRLIARNAGEFRAHSFAHRAEDMAFDCVSSGESALHKRAKEIIAKHCRVTLPATSTPGPDGKLVEVTPARSITLRDVKLEALDGEVIPDVTATMPDGRRIFIEIANTHFCSPEKIAKLDAMGVEVLEITVSAYCAVPLDELDDIILDIAPRKLILSSEVKAMAAKFAEDRRKQDETKRADAQRLVDIYRGGVPDNHKQAQGLVEKMVRRGLLAHIDNEDDRPSAFIVYRRQWQAAIFDKLVHSDYNAPISAFDVAEAWSERWAKPGLRYVKSDHARWIAKEVAEDFKSPYEEIAAYLERLRSVEIVYKASRGGAYYMHDRFKAELQAIIEKEELPAKRRGQLFGAVKTIADLMEPYDGKLEHFDSWLKKRATEYGMRERTLLSNDGNEFQDLMVRLRRIPVAVAALQRSHHGEPDEDMVGLALDGMFQRLRIARDLAKERLEAERTARRVREAAEAAKRLKQEAADRVFKIEEEAIFVVGDAEVFLQAPLPGYDGKTSRELAAESISGFMAVQRELDRISNADRAAAEADRIRKDMVGKLWEQVYKRIPRKDVAELWPIQRWPELDGMKPIDYCKDKKTLERCFEVLEGWVKTEQKRGRR